MGIIAKVPTHALSPVGTSAPSMPVETSQAIETRVHNLKLQRVKEATDKKDYQRALELLPADGQDIESRNCRAVCMMRLGRFEQAFTILRTSVVNSGTQVTRGDVATHIRVNFATALFYGGQPAGALDVLAELNREEDPGVQALRQATTQWVAEMRWFQRVDWMINRVAPKKLPVADTEKPLGRFFWDVS